MTDPRGRSFLSYPRARKCDAELLIAAQNDVGIPTCQDVHSLDTGPTDEELERVLHDPSTASAILWVTPDVPKSMVTISQEASAILCRDRRNDPFFAIPVAAGGCSYRKAAGILQSTVPTEGSSCWLVRHAAADPLGDFEAARVAFRVLSRRVEAIHGFLPRHEPLRVVLHSRHSAPTVPTAALHVNWSHRFDARAGKAGIWDRHLLPALASIAHVIEEKAFGRAIEISGSPSIPQAAAFGWFSVRQRHRAAAIICMEEPRGRDAREWRLGSGRKKSGFAAHTCAEISRSADLAVLLSVTEDTRLGMEASRDVLPPFCALIEVRKEGAGFPVPVASAAEAEDIALITRDAIKDAVHHLKGVKRVHLFMAVPWGLAMMMGQYLNALPPVQTYEYAPGHGAYRPAALLDESVSHRRFECTP